MTRKAKTGVEVLQAMEWLIDNVGWCQGTNYRDKYGGMMQPFTDPSEYDHIKSMCINGAMRLVETETCQAYIDAVNLFSDANTNFILFNDAPGRTKKQIITALRKAIKKGSKK